MSNYYVDNTKEFIEDTFNCDMSYQYNFFEKYLTVETKTILDIGFGSGRDSLYFQNKGYDVSSLDPVESFCMHAKEIGLKKIYQMRVQDMNFNNEFDAIWACASLLHIPTYEMVYVLNKCYDSLKENGVMYCSFKHGDYEGERNGRFFIDLIETRFKQFVEKTNFIILEVCVTEDVRPDRNEKWLNVVLKK